MGLLIHHMRLHAPVVVPQPPAPEPDPEPVPQPVIHRYTIAVRQTREFSGFPAGRATGNSPASNSAISAAQIDTVRFNLSGYVFDGRSSLFRQTWYNITGPNGYSLRLSGRGFSPGGGVSWAVPDVAGTYAVRGVYYEVFSDTDPFDDFDDSAIHAQWEGTGRVVVT